jgi:hypothetical protein
MNKSKLDAIERILIITGELLTARAELVKNGITSKLIKSENSHPYSYVINIGEQGTIKIEAFFGIHGLSSRVFQEAPRIDDIKKLLESARELSEQNLDRAYEQQERSFTSGVEPGD